MDLIMKMSERMVSYGTMAGVAGVAMAASIILAAPGVLMILVGVALVILGLIVRLSAPSLGNFLATPLKEAGHIGSGAATS